MKVSTEIQHERDLVKVAAKPAEIYSEMSLTAMTAYSLYWLHQWRLSRTIEAVAILNWRLFPLKFAMVGFQEYPDAFRTNRSLLQMQPKYRNLLTGAAVKGFSLNERGMDTARELIEILGVPTTDAGDNLGSVEKRDAPSKRGGLARSIEPEREVERVRASKLYDKWQAGIMTDRDLIHVHTLLGVFDHTPAALRVKAMKELEKNAGDLNDEEVLRFLNEVRKIFPQVFMG